MKTMQDWFDAYAVSHQNETNKKVHFICVPAIFFSIVGLLMSIPSGFMEAFLPPMWAHFATVVGVAVTLFYLRLSLPIALGMVVWMVFCIWANFQIAQVASLPLVSVAIFVLAWIGQFWGHKVEGQKPSFLEDVQFLMIGPAWVMGFLFRRWGIAY